MTRDIDDTEAEWLDPDDVIELDEEDAHEEATTHRISGIRAKKEELRARAEEALRAIRDEAFKEIESATQLRDTPAAAEGSERALELGRTETAKKSEGEARQEAEITLESASDAIKPRALPRVPSMERAAQKTAPLRWYTLLFQWLGGALRLAIFFMIGVAIGSLVAMALVELLGPRAHRGEAGPGMDDARQLSPLDEIGAGRSRFRGALHSGALNDQRSRGERRSTEEPLRSERGALPDIGKPSDAL